MSLWMIVLITAVSLLIDWSAAGPTALRDRIAAIGYLAATLGWLDTIGFAAWEATAVSGLGHTARNLWSMGSAVPAILWFFAMAPALPIFGRVGQITFRVNWTGRGRGKGKSKGKSASGDESSSAERINTNLLVWSAAVAAAAPLSFPSTYQTVLFWVQDAAVTGALAAGNFIAYLGGWS
jgi:hypothetical protein